MRKFFIGLLFFLLAVFFFNAIADAADRGYDLGRLRMLVADKCLDHEAVIADIGLQPSDALLLKGADAEKFKVELFDMFPPPPERVHPVSAVGLYLRGFDFIVVLFDDKNCAGLSAALPAPMVFMILDGIKGTE